eukprot:g7650.t1
MRAWMKYKEHETAFSTNLPAIAERTVKHGIRCRVKSEKCCWCKRQILLTQPQESSASCISPSDPLQYSLPQGIAYEGSREK